MKYQIETTNGYLLTDSDKAFMKSFKETHNQYEVQDKDLVGFLCNEDEYFDGYTQVADAYNLWGDANKFARGQA